MSHLWDSVNMIMDMGIPETCVTQGSLYFWKEEVEVPDMWHSIFDYPKKELTITFSSNFVNNHVGDLVQILGREGAMEASPSFCRVYPGTRQKSGQPVYSFKPGELEVSSHWQNLIDCIRTGERPRCDEDRAFEEAVTVVMSIEAYRRRREVRWDAGKEEIV